MIDGNRYDKGEEDVHWLSSSLFFRLPIPRSPFHRSAHRFGMHVVESVDYLSGNGFNQVMQVYHSCYKKTRMMVFYVI